MAPELALAYGSTYGLDAEANGADSGGGGSGRCFQVLGFDVMLDGARRHIAAITAPSLPCAARVSGCNSVGPSRYTADEARACATGAEAGAPHILEVNHNPSFAIPTALDESIKYRSLLATLAHIFPAGATMLEGAEVLVPEPLPVPPAGDAGESLKAAFAVPLACG